LDYLADHAHIEARRLAATYRQDDGRPRLAAQHQNAGA
jgi:hypothetical protein